MFSFDQIIQDFENTFKLADIPFEQLQVGVIRWLPNGSRIHNRMPAAGHWFTDCLHTMSQQAHPDDVSLNTPAFPRSEPVVEEIFIVHQGLNNRCELSVLVWMPLENIHFRHFTKAICRLLAEAVCDGWICSAHFSPDNLCRSASRLVMQELMSITPAASQSLFNQLDRIASLPYEDRKSYGSIVFQPANAPLVEEAIHLKKPVAFSNVRGIRKLLEIGGDKFWLLASEEGVYGLGLRIDERVEVAQVDFVYDNSWVLSWGERKIFKIHAGLPIVFRPKLEEAYFHQRVRAVFPTLNPEQTSDLFNLLGYALNQARGTNILVTCDALTVAQRLESQCTLIDPIRLTPDMMAHVSLIDGTVIIDPTCVCVGFGAILDGQAARHGDSARGGRYNSAVMFCEHSATNCLILVVSQDGTVDIVTSTKENS